MRGATWTGESKAGAADEGAATSGSQRAGVGDELGAEPSSTAEREAGATGNGAAIADQSLRLRCCQPSRFVVDSGVQEPATRGCTATCSDLNRQNASALQFRMAACSLARSVQVHASRTVMVRLENESHINALTLSASSQETRASASWSRRRRICLSWERKRCGTVFSFSSTNVRI
jgi:hypothetical protein